MAQVRPPPPRGPPLPRPRRSLRAPRCGGGTQPSPTRTGGLGLGLGPRDSRPARRLPPGRLGRGHASRAGEPAPGGARLRRISWVPRGGELEFSGVWWGMGLAFSCGERGLRPSPGRGREEDGRDSGPVSRSPIKRARTGGSLRSVLRLAPCSARRGSQRVTAGGGSARLGVALVPLPLLLQLSGRYRLNEYQRCPVADWTPVGEWGVSASRLVVVLLLWAALSSLPPGRAVPRLPSAREGARCSSLLLWWGELILGSRLGSLTQIRHDKEGESGTCAEAQAWAEPGGS